MPHRYFFQLNKMNTHANKLLSLHKEKQILKNQVLKDKLVRQNLIDSASLYIQPVIDEQEKAKDETIAAIKALGGPPTAKLHAGQSPAGRPLESNEKQQRFERIYQIDFRGIDQSLPKSIRPVFTPEGFKIGSKFIEVNPETRQMRVQGQERIYDITQELIDLIKGEPLDNYSDTVKDDYRNLLEDVQGSRMSKRMRHLSSTPKKGEGLPFGPFVSFLSDNTQELKDHLQKLLSAAKEGHSNVYNQGMAVLKRLLEKGELEKTEFSRLVKNFSP